MSRRRRCAKKKAARVRVARAKVLRRRARGAGARRAATAATAAAVTLAGVGSAAFATPTERAETVEEAAGSAGASQVQCPDPHTPPSEPSELCRCGGNVVLHRRRRHPRPGAVEVGWHQGGHRPGQGHPPRCDYDSGPSSPDRCGRDVVLHRRRRHPRPGAVEVRWHQGGHRPGQGHPARCLRQRSLPP